MFVIITIIPFNAIGKIEEKKNYIATQKDPDCDGRLWLWGPYGGWVGESIDFTPTILSLDREDGWRLGECCVDFLWEFGDGNILFFKCCTMEEYQEKKPNRVSHVYDNNGLYTVKLTVSSPFLELYDKDDVVIKNTNPNSPNKPIVKYKRVNNVDYYVHQYLIVTNDLDNDPVRFYFEFEDGYIPWHPNSTQYGCTKFYYSGETARIWEDAGETNGKCRIKAQDIWGAESDWVSVRSKNISNSLFLRLFNYFQILDKLLFVILQN